MVAGAHPELHVADSRSPRRRIKRSLMKESRGNFPEGRLHSAHVTPSEATSASFSPPTPRSGEPADRSSHQEPAAASPISSPFSPASPLLAQYSPIVAIIAVPDFPVQSLDFFSLFGRAAPLHQQWIRSRTDPVLTPELGSGCSSQGGKRTSWRGVLGRFRAHAGL